MELLKAQQRAYKLQKRIEKLCILFRLNLCNYDGGIGFVDQDLKKIVMVWKPEYKMSDIPGHKKDVQ